MISDAATRAYAKIKDKYVNDNTNLLLEIYAQMGDENSVAAKALKGDTNETP